MKHAGIIAAGDGTRLAKSHPGLIKPLVPVGGVPLVHWVARSLQAAGVEDVTVLFNSRGRQARASLEQAFPRLSWSFLEADTASSWESFRLVCRTIAGKADRFLVSTVDSLIPPSQMGLFAAKSSGQAASLALTAFVDDEKPLWADVDAGGFITALGPKAVQKRLVTSGLYQMSAGVAAKMPSASAHDRLRSYWGDLIDGGERVLGVALSKTVDVDRPEDIREAEAFVHAASSNFEVK